MSLDKQKVLLENAIALSAAVHGSKNYDKFYQAVAERVGGFPGIYDAIAALAIELTSWEERFTPDDGSGENAYDREGVDWPELVDALAERFMEHATKHAYFEYEGLSVQATVEMMKHASSAAVRLKKCANPDCGHARDFHSGANEQDSELLCSMCTCGDFVDSD